MPVFLEQEGFRFLKEEGFVPSALVRMELGQIPILPTLWEAIEKYPSVAFFLDHTLSMLAKTNVGHVLESLSLVVSISCQLEENGTLPLEDDFGPLHESTAWKTFLLHCWIEEVSPEIEERYGPTWQILMSECFCKLEELVPDLLQHGKYRVMDTIVNLHLQGKTESLDGGEESPSNRDQEERAVYSGDCARQCRRLSPPGSNFARVKSHFYAAVLGYDPPDSILPSNIQMVKALSRGLPPPLCRSPSLWQFFEISPPSSCEKLVAINYCSMESTGRQFATIGALALNTFLAMHDISAGEILSSDLEVTALTFDIDGKTVDTRIHSPETVYPPDLVTRDLMSVVRECMLETTSGRWDAFKHKPAVHVWQASGENKEKLSMRISVHLPENIYFLSLEALRHFVRTLTDHVKHTKQRYLTVSYVTVDEGIRFEKSLASEGEWHGMKEGIPIGLEDHIRRLSREGKEVRVKCKGDSYTISKSSKCGYRVRDEGTEGTVHVFDLSSWLSCTVARKALVETFVDVGIYANNHSIRLPEQSKFVDGTKVRKFVAHTKGSMPVDALLHYPHRDTPAIPGPPVRIKYRTEDRKRPKHFVSVHAKEDMATIKAFISSKYKMEINRVTANNSGSTSFIYVSSPGDGMSSRQCLVKEGPHSNARMYLVYDGQRRTLRANCWSDKCQERLRSHGSPGGILLCDLS